ncbi:bifunctional alpha,alpha-trehalose-phosphate synthase (UDP-forming)/trehalose-phosphatase [Pendulispora albinea]|uniref:Alpha,alpha-trehalose-phosphate synthase n=1 Tax=Pendulispora albinea TaxID=2741071 RepID=A0ABZ2LZH5_9BACT
MPRLLLVSNRLPVTVKADARESMVIPSSGGLATGLRGPHQRSDGLWIGWPGDTSKLKPAQLAQVNQELADLKTVPVQLTASEVSRFYEGFSNGVLWPLFHYLLQRVPIDVHDWDAYRRVNYRFADAVIAQYREGDLIWVHDYQLTLVPGILRKALPRAKIGFFLHIPFPATDVFRILPWREEILDGMLGADLVGFHTYGYLRHFAKSIVRSLDASFSIDRIPYQGRTVRLGVFPMGIDVASFEKLATDDDVLAQVRSIREEAKGQQLFLGVDRLDYTKGIQYRLFAMERLLEREPKLRGRVRLIQVAVPSRERVDAYASFRRQVDETVGRINGTYGSVGQAPIHYLYRSFSQRQITALYRAADVMMVTPLRDGMNLVAKEFVASRTDGDGVLVLSEFAGAHSELGEAITVNPYDIEGMAASFKRALRMPEEERRSRMRTLRERIQRHDVHRWADSFIATMEHLPQAEPIGDTPSTHVEIEDLLERLREAPSLALFLDYDGTLAPLELLPEMAVPTKEVKALLASLTHRSRPTHVSVVSGRTRESLDEWLGDLPIALYAEHGAWGRDHGQSWSPMRELQSEWKAALRPILNDFTDRTPGSRTEEKWSSIAWHYRMADAEFGPVQARELATYLTDILSNAPVEVIHGHKVVEIRQQGIHKGIIVDRVLERIQPALVLAIGDDRTDEDMFRALPPNGIAIHVGQGRSAAQYRLADPSAVSVLLRALI